MSSVMTPIGMLNFPNLFAAKAPVEGAEPRFSVVLIFDKKAQATPEWAALVQAVNETIDAKWGAGKHKDALFIKRNKIAVPWRDCSEKEYAGYDVDGGVFISPWSKQRPGVINGAMEDVISAADVWGGQLGRCTVHPFPYDVSGNRGVGLNLNNLQITKMKMPRLDGRKAASQEFGKQNDDEDAGGEGLF